MVGFAADGRLLKISVTGGPPLPITDVELLRGASWALDDTIILAPGLEHGLMRVPAAGGEPEAITTVEGNDSHRWPQVLPDGKTVLFNMLTSGRYDQSAIALLSMETDEITVLPVVGTDPHYVPPGYLVFGRGESLFAVPFDVDRLEVTGSPASVIEGVLVTVAGPGSVYFAVADTGTVVYMPALPNEHSLVLVDRQGREQPLPLQPGAFSEPRFSPDGRQIAYVLADQTDIWVHDLDRGTTDRFTTDGADDYSPLWAADGESLIFSSDRAGYGDLFRKLTTGGPVAEVLATSGNYRYPTSLSPDGRFLLYTEQSSATDLDVWVLDTMEPDDPRPLVQTEFMEAAASFSPDGRWIAYASDESGRSEVYVTPFSSQGRRVRISTQGGVSPLWGPDGRQLFFWSSAGMLMSVAVSPAGELTVGEARPLFGGAYLTSDVFGAERTFDIAPDGQSFVVIRQDDQGLDEMVLITNWFDELKRLVPTDP